MLPTVALLGQYAGTLEVLDSTRVSARATQPAPVIAGQAPIIGMDVATALTARVVLTSRTMEFVASYSPTLTLPDIELGVAPIVIQGGLVSSSWHDRHLRVSLSEIGTYGQLNSGLLYQPVAVPGQPPAVEAAPAAQTIDYGASISNGSLAYAVDRHTTVTVLASYSYRGGLTAAAQGLLPLQTMVRAGASAAYALSRQDLLTTQANAQEVDTRGQCPPPIGDSTPAPAPTAFCNEEAQVVQLEQTITHRLSSATLLSAGGGAALVLNHALNLHDTEYVPTALVSLASQGVRSRVSLSAQLAPIPDLRTGLVNDRIESTATWTETLDAGSSLSLSTGVLRSVSFVNGDDPYPLTVVNGEVLALMHLGRALDVGFGVRAFWQEQTGYGNFGSEIAYVTVNTRVPTVHF
jgi:hypothetical protein